MRAHPCKLQHYDNNADSRFQLLHWTLLHRDWFSIEKKSVWLPCRVCWRWQLSILQTVIDTDSRHREKNLLKIEYMASASDRSRLHMQAITVLSRSIRYHIRCHPPEKMNRAAGTRHPIANIYYYRFESRSLNCRDHTQYRSIASEILLLNTRCREKFLTL